jgi:cytidylyltransferase-like protein
MRWIIFAGRFQPFHVGHFEIVRQSLERIISGDVLILAAISPEPSSIRAVDENFAMAAAEHHLPERNPWPVPIRLLALSAIAAHFRHTYPHIPVAVSAIPRPDYGWDTVRAWFPGSRVWVIPSAGEAFDEAKAKFFIQNGEQVIRYTDPTKVSGKELRELWESGHTEQMKPYLPECVHEAYLWWR